jgi:uncharacterized protein
MELEFEWDEEKRLSNIEKHNLDFRRALEIFDGRPVLLRESERDNEPRFITVGPLDGRYIAVVWTPRGSAIRIISARRARDGERKQYYQTFGA